MARVERSDGAVNFVFATPVVVTGLAWVLLYSGSLMALLAPLAAVFVSSVVLLVALVLAIRKRERVFLFGALWAAGAIALTFVLVTQRMASGGPW